MSGYHYDDFYGEIPKKTVFFSFAAAMVLDFIPFSVKLLWLPEFTALMVIYWLINCPRQVNLGTAFFVGLLTDIGTVSLLGSHSLAYTLSAYVIVSNHRQFGMQNYGFQAVVVLLALVGNEAILAAIRFIVEQRFIGWEIFTAPFTGALLWPLLNKLMLYIINYKRLRR